MMRFLFSSLSVLLALLVTVDASPKPKPGPPKDFVSTRGSEFVLNGKPFAFVGANSYAMVASFDEPR